MHVSPFGAISKGDPVTGAIRLIHDLSFPRGASANDATDKLSLPPLHYEHVAALAHRIDALRVRFPVSPILMLKGDVNGAFRHLRQHADDVGWMCGLLPDRCTGVIDLSAPFGWTSSPAIYGMFGRAFSFLVSRESPTSMCQSARTAKASLPMNGSTTTSWLKLMLASAVPSQKIRFDWR